MLTTINTDIRVKDIIRLLPVDQINHMSKVGMLVSKLVKELPYYDKYPNKSSAVSNLLEYFGRAAFYHDIGKVCVPPNILSKTGKLTTEEFHIIQRHVLAGEKLFQHIRGGNVQGMPEYLIPLAHDSAVYHHEWWNGKGYPYGIRNEHIPLIARITSICDAYDAMTSNRSYRNAHSHDYACCELKKNAGTQFDPNLIRVFLAHETKFLRLYEEEAVIGK